jgi:enamine deaminase RidA (YjgF/YER057c/UK114 family)
MKTAIIPAGSEGLYRNFHFAPAIKAGGLLFISGQLGLTPERRPADGIPAQIDLAFESIGRILGEAGLDYSAIVELGSFHVGPLADHMPAMVGAIAQTVGEPYPAWTAIEVSGLAVTGALVEIKATALAG